MVVFLLFAILLVLLIMAGLLPSVMKFIAIAAFIGVFIYIVDTYGWLTVFIGSTAVVAVALLALFFNKRDRDHAARPSYDTDAALARINKAQRESRAMQPKKPESPNNFERNMETTEEKRARVKARVAEIKAESAAKR
ncbi:hypothetical protein F0A16_20675 [Salinicola corii]|uniref:Uncharacterized protein n=1 Tax=Salinicola corii TaxID=2606937 RepID=A0A640W8J9_9GAMM|nr:hypothetical protein [Salinicola corii]KAA0015504.1 hypothetical protein F0A16_20675 [Salinicola corii]